MRTSIKLAGGLVALLCLVPTTALASSNKTARADRAVERALSAFVKTKQGPPGAAAVIQRNEKRRFISAGVSRVGSTRKPRINDHMRVASVAKAFSGAVALSLIDRSKLAVTTPIAGLAGTNPAWSAVTAGQLMSHTSGVPDFAATKALQQALGAAPTAIVPPAQLLSYVKDTPLVFSPGSKYEYSNSDNIVLALLAQQAGGITYEQALRSLVFDRLGLRNTSLPAGTAMSRPVWSGYDTSGRKPENVTNLVAASWSWASGGVVSTPADLNRFMRGYVAGRLFGAPTRSQQFQFVAGSSQPPGPGTNSAGLSLFRYETRCGTIFGHTGNTFGYTQFAASTRDGRRSATLSVNTQLSSNRWPAFRKLAERVACAALS